MRDFNIDLSGTQLFLARVVKVTRLDGAVLRIAEAETAITISSQTFLPLPGCEISAIRHIINGGVGSMEIRFAHSHGGTLDTFQLNTGFWDGARVQAWVVDRSLVGGTLGDPLFTGLIDTVMLDPIGAFGSFDVRGLSVESEAFIQTYSPMCRTDLFSVLCSLNPASWLMTGTVDTIIDRFNFTVAGLGAPPTDGWFNQGTFVAASGFKGVIANWIQGSLKMTTYQPVCMSRLTVGEGMTLYPGCDKTGNTCRTKFSNKLNFQGEDHFLGIASIVGMPT
jgi:uncharacterized phage protein (TIGR02218 family)